jgi:murein DD-endopeptidase MepM/ murein hydrolase activator NlpD
MLISPPFITTRGTNQTEDEWLNSCMVGGIPGDGAFPVSFNLGWHGGMHLNAPMNGAVAEPVRAIADGTVVYFKAPTPRPTEPQATDPQMYRGQWTDNGVVIIRHDTEIGDGANGKVSFFSVYMHMREIESTVVIRGRDISRKTAIGNAGRIYGDQNKIHFEIITDDANLLKLVGRAAGDLPVTVNGRSNAVHGEIYFHLPTGVQIFAAQPALNIATPAISAAHTTTENLIVGLRYAGGSGAEPDRGDAYLTTYKLDGATLGVPLNENQAEYQLFTNANTICNLYPPSGKPNPSVVYELLRFGRVVGPNALAPADVPHWRQVRYSATAQGWVNLNAANVHKFSDADFPHWRNWKLIDDDKDADSRCDSPTIKGWLDTNGDGKVLIAEATARLSDAAIAEKLKKTICKFPTEWEAATIDTRWGWTKKQTDENPTPVSEADFERLKKHLTQLSYWQEAALQTQAVAATANLPAVPAVPIPANHWHWQPREFIKHFRQSGIWPNVITRWRAAETNHDLPDETGLSKLGKTILYEFGLKTSIAASKNHQNQNDYASFRAIDNRRPLIFGMRIETDIDANQGKGEWDDRVTVLKRDETGLLEHSYSGLFTTEPSGRYLARGRYLTPTHPLGDGQNVGGTADRDIGRLIANRTYEYAPFAHTATDRFGPNRFGNTANPNQFNILKKTVGSQAERLVVNVANLPDGQHISSANSTWQTGTATAYSEERTMHFHKGYNGLTGSAGCQTFPVAAGQRIDDFVAKLQPMDATSRFQYVLTLL